MSPSAEKIPGRLPMLLAGLQAGTVAALAMLAWMGLSAVWERRSFWTSENLLATTFYGGGALRNSFSTRTLSGLALYLVIYSLFGCVFAIAAGEKLNGRKRLVAGITAALVWYYVSFHFIWSALSPLVPLLHAVRPTVVGHIIYGAAIARFPQYFQRQPRSATEVAAAEIAPATIEAATAASEVSDAPQT